MFSFRWAKRGGAGSRCRSWLLALAAVLGGLIVSSPRLVMAAETEEGLIEADSLPPLVVINVAGVERLLGDVDYLFKSIGRDDLSEMVNAFLPHYGDLKGFDRKKSFGVMLYFKPGLTPQVTPVGFLPVDSIGDLLKTLELDSVGAKTRKVPGEIDRYEIEGPRETFQVQLQNGFAYVSTAVEAFDRKLPDPGPLTQALTTRYDLAASINVEGIPEGMRTIFLDFLRAQTEAEMQQRDEEPEAEYRARRAAGLNNLQSIEAILKDGQSITLGIDASRETKSIVIEIEVKAKPSTEFARQIKKFPGKPSIFSGVYSETMPLAATGSWNLQPEEKKAFSEFVKAFEIGLSDRLIDEMLDPSPVKGMVKSLNSTVESGAMDFFLQFVGEPPGKFSLVGAVRLDHSGDFASGLQGLLQQFANHPDVAEMELNAIKHNGIGVHRLVGKSVSRGEQRLYGEKMGFYVGAGRGAVWFAVGGDDAPDLLKSVMDRVESRPQTPAGQEAAAPFQMVLNLSSWFGLNPDGKGRFRENAREAFKPENDRLLITMKPIEDGVRLKVQLDEGFIRLIGLQISEQMDRDRI